MQRSHITRAAAGGSGGRPPGGFAYLGTHEYSSTAETTKTFTFNLGDVYASKHLIMVNTAANASDPSSILSATVAGVSVSALTGNSDRVRLDLLSCPIGAVGGDQTVTITYNRTVTKGFISFYNVDSDVFNTTTPATVSTRNSGAVNNAVLTGLTAGSLAIGGACSNEVDAGVTIGGLDTDFSGESPGNEQITLRSGSLSPTGTSVTLTYTSTDGGVVRVLGAFAPI